MRLEGWNSIPIGAEATFDLSAAPIWLKVIYHAPFIDRFAFPLLVARGHGSLSVTETTRFDAAAALAQGWVIMPEEYVAPGSVSSLAHREGPAG